MTKPAAVIAATSPAKRRWRSASSVGSAAAEDVPDRGDDPPAAIDRHSLRVLAQDVSGTDRGDCGLVPREPGGAALAHDRHVASDHGDGHGIAEHEQRDDGGALHRCVSALTADHEAD